MRNTKKKKNPVFRISNRQIKTKINLSEIKKVFENNPEVFSSPPEEVGIIIVSDRLIKKINRQFLKKNCPTDVISFKLSRKYGEVIISAETAFRNSCKYGNTIENEIIYLIIHGYLHLKNYRDYSFSQREKMLTVQDALFHQLTGEQ